MVGYLLHNSQVVGDEQEGQPAAGLQFLQEFQQLRLYGYIKGTDRFIADEEFGFNRQGPGQQEPLALAAAQLNRVAVDRCMGQVDSLQQIPDAGQEFLSVEIREMQQQWLGEELPGIQSGIQGLPWILEDQLNALPERLEGHRIKRAHL